jgi:hypothetical protein
VDAAFMLLLRHERGDDADHHDPPPREMTFWLILITKRLASGDHRHSRFGKSVMGFLAEVPRA